MIVVHTSEITESSLEPLSVSLTGTLKKTKNSNLIFSVYFDNFGGPLFGLTCTLYSIT